MEHHPAVSILAYWRAGLWVIAMAMKLKPRTTKSRSMLLLSSLIFLDSTCFISISVSDASYVSSCHILYFVVALRAASSELDPLIDHLYKGKRRVEIENERAPPSFIMHVGYCTTLVGAAVQ